MIATMIQILFIKYKQSLLITLTKTFPLWIRRSISLTGAVNNIRIAKITLCHQQDFNMDAKWIFFATSYGNTFRNFSQNCSYEDKEFLQYDFDKSLTKIC